MQPKIRFHNQAAAELVAKHAQDYTNVRLEVGWVTPNDPSCENGKFGRFFIHSNELHGGIWSITNKFSDLIDFGTQRALASALHATDPQNPLCTIWHLRPDIKTPARFDFDLKSIDSIRNLMS